MSDGVSLGMLVFEIKDILEERGVGDILLFVVGGIVDGRGVVVVLCLGVFGVVMGIRFLCFNEVRIKKGYQDVVFEVKDGGKNIVRIYLYNYLRGMFGWLEERWVLRIIVNRSWEEYIQGGSFFDQLKEKYDQSVKEDGDKVWGRQIGRMVIYVGSGVGLVRSVDLVGEIVEKIREEVKKILRGLQSGLQVQIGLQVVLIRRFLYYKIINRCFSVCFVGV